MSFVKNMKRAFGFGDDEAEDDDILDEETSVAGDKAETAASEETSEPEAGAELPLAIFDGVIEVFNAAQPDFIKSCLDVDAQRRYLYQAMDSSLKEYLAEIGEATRRKAMQSWGEEHTRLQDQHQELQRLQRRAEESQAEQQQQKLSTQRQKRALNDRIRELEKRVLELESEREQLELETKSLVNKLKVADVKDSDLSAQRDEIALLKEQLKQAEATISQKEEQIKSASETKRKSAAEEDVRAMEEIQQRLMQFEDVKRKKDAQIEKQAARIAHLEGDMAALQERLQQALASKDEVSPEGEKPRRRQRKDDKGASPKRRQKTKISAIDESMDGIEWLLSTPGEDETVSKAVASSSSDSDFGYQPPVRKEIVVDNDAQLSLF